MIKNEWQIKASFKFLQTCPIMASKKLQRYFYIPIAIQRGIRDKRHREG